MKKKNEKKEDGKKGRKEKAYYDLINIELITKRSLCRACFSRRSQRSHAGSYIIGCLYKMKSNEIK